MLVAALLARSTDAPRIVSTVDNAMATVPALLPQHVRVMTWNILAPELMSYFWRSTYGLPVPAKPEEEIRAVTAARMSNIAAAIRAAKPDIVLLQETSDTAFFPDGKSCVAWIANATGLRVASGSSKGSRFHWGHPPAEQPGRGAPHLSMDSGVTTLYDPGTVAHVRSVATAETFGPSAVFGGKGWGSPFTVDAFAILPIASHATAATAAEGSGSRPFVVVNTHIRMQFPHIAAPLEEVAARVRSALRTGSSGSSSSGGAGGSGGGGSEVWKRVVLAGDVNAGHSAAAADYRAAVGAGGPLSGLTDAFDPTLSTAADDHMLVGPGLTVAARETSTLPLLDMHTNSQLPASDSRLWSRPDTQYQLNEKNAALLASGRATSDHPYLLVVLQV